MEIVQPRGQLSVIEPGVFEVRTKSQPAADCMDMPPSSGTGSRSAMRHESRSPSVKPRGWRRRQTRLNSKESRSSSSDDDSDTVRAKHAHSIIERRYRDNLKNKMMQLQLILDATERTTGHPRSPFQTLVPHQSGKVRKAAIITKAITYIQQSEVNIRSMSDKIQYLQSRIHLLEGLVKCGDCPLLENAVRTHSHPQ